MKQQWKTIFVSGGAGYIGSHCIVELLHHGYEVIVVDNFVNCVDEEGEASSLKRVRQITGRDVKFYQCDLLDENKLDHIFSLHSVDCIIHFAAMKAVGESMEYPLLYYQNNLISGLNLLKVMKKYGCQQLIFSSSCCVYGNPEFLPITEEHPTGNVTNVYGKTKYFIEEMLKDISTAEEGWNIISLRYFNPIGAHPSGLLGEDPTKPFTNLMPYIAQVALKKKEVLRIFGGDYDTADGTGVRDYIHVMDLAAGHLAALKKLQAEHLNLKVNYYAVPCIAINSRLKIEVLMVTHNHLRPPGLPTSEQVGDDRVIVCSRRHPDLESLKASIVKAVKVYNLGTGEGTTVLQLIRTFEQVCGKSIPYKIEDRRKGDIVSMYANTDLARKELNWKTKYSLRQMCEDFWRWQIMNPNGYRSVISDRLNTCTTSSTNCNNATNGCS